MSNDRGLGALLRDIPGGLSNFDYGALHHGGLPVLNVGDSRRETLHILLNGFRRIVNIADHTALTAAMLVFSLLMVTIRATRRHWSNYC